MSSVAVAETKVAPTPVGVAKNPKKTKTTALVAVNVQDEINANAAAAAAEQTPVVAATKPKKASTKKTAEQKTLETTTTVQIDDVPAPAKQTKAAAKKAAAAADASSNLDPVEKMRANEIEKLQKQIAIWKSKSTEDIQSIIDKKSAKKASTVADAPPKAEKPQINPTLLADDVQKVLPTSKFVLSLDSVTKSLCVTDPTTNVKQQLSVAHLNELCKLPTDEHKLFCSDICTINKELTEKQNKPSIKTLTEWLNRA